MNVFISCGKEKQNHRCKAKDLYTGVYFEALWNYGESLNADNIYILSGKHHVLEPNQEVDPYNVYLGDFSAEQREEWARKTIKKMKEMNIDFNAKTYFLASKDYCEYLVDSFPNAVCPFDKPSIKGMGDIMSYCVKHTPNKKTNEGYSYKGIVDFLYEQLNISKKKILLSGRILR